MNGLFVTRTDTNVGKTTIFSGFALVLKEKTLFRAINQTKEIRISGGREVKLRSLQPLGLYADNSIFVGDYLTTAGQEENEDYKMLRDLGFVVESVEEM